MGHATLPTTLRNWLVTALQDFPHPVTIQFWEGETLNLGKAGNSAIQLKFLRKDSGVSNLVVARFSKSREK